MIGTMPHVSVIPVISSNFMSRERKYRMVSGDTAAPPGWLPGGRLTYGVRLGLASVRAKGLMHLRQHQPVRQPVAEACVRHTLLLCLVVCQGLRLRPLDELKKVRLVQVPSCFTFFFSPPVAALARTPSSIFSQTLGTPASLVGRYS